MIRPKKRRTDLAVPAYVGERWNSGTAAKTEMEDLLLETNGDKDKFMSELLLIVKKIKKFVVKRDQGWYTELEMKNDLGWARIQGAKKLCEADPTLHRRNQYDGQWEYYVTVRETAVQTQSHEVQEEQRQYQKASKPIEFKPDEFQDLDKAMARGSLPDSAAVFMMTCRMFVAGVCNPHYVTPGQHKATAERFMDSLLAKCTKIRGLIKDLKANYSQDCQKHVDGLQEHVSKLETEHGKLTEQKAKGEVEGFNTGSSRATASELQVPEPLSDRLHGCCVHKVYLPLQMLSELSAIYPQTPEHKGSIDVMVLGFRCMIASISIVHCHALAVSL
ncbi:unnamed protein product [Symbiodinium sp. CCMP2592]|nr:unnamed protein product [Symbiodinium sp. CCMP2592]